MLSEELYELVRLILSQKYEMQNIELKKAEKGSPEKLYDSLFSFSNQSGDCNVKEEIYVFYA